MIITIQQKRTTLSYRAFSALIVFMFIFNLIILPQKAYAQSVLNLPQPGTMILTTPSFIPPMVRGIVIYPDNPLRFDFIIDAGDDNLQGTALEKESNKLIKYFLTSLTVPEKEMWVNLSPYEKDRIIAIGLGKTEMGRDLLAQDYMLKQLTASLMFPGDELGKEFWKRVYTKAQEKYGTTEIPMNTFNKIWIVPDKANVYVNGTSVFVAESHLKVMFEEDYLALESNMGSVEHGLGKITKDDIEIISGVSSEIVREVLIPEIEKEVNSGEHFSNLRQIYNSMILATWYKQNLKRSLLGQIYVDKSKVKGIDLKDREVNQQIYDQYVKAFEKGVFDFIREDYDEATQEVIPRKYFSGGLDLPVSDRLGKVVTGLAVSEALEDRPINTVSFYLDTVKSIDNFRRIINVLARSESVPGLPENATEGEIMEYVLDYWTTNDLIGEKRTVDGDVQVFVIKDEVKNTRLGKAIQKYVVERKRGVQAINFLGTDAIWKIVGFQGEIYNQLDLEREEVRRRKKGEHWILAMVGARGEKLPTGLVEGSQKIKAGRNNIISASAKQNKLIFVKGTPPGASGIFGWESERDQQKGYLIEREGNVYLNPARVSSYDEYGQYLYETRRSEAEKFELSHPRDSEFIPIIEQNSELPLPSRREVYRDIARGVLRYKDGQVVAMFGAESYQRNKLTDYRNYEKLRQNFLPNIRRHSPENVEGVETEIASLRSEDQDYEVSDIPYASNANIETQV